MPPSAPGRWDVAAVKLVADRFKGSVPLSPDLFNDRGHLAGEFVSTSPASVVDPVQLWISELYPSSLQRCQSLFRAVADLRPLELGRHITVDREYLAIGLQVELAVLLEVRGLLDQVGDDVVADLETGLDEETNRWR